MLVEEILIAEDAWFSAAFAASGEQYEKILSPTFTFVMHGGDIFDKKRFLASVQNKERKLNSMQWTDFAIHPYGTTAIVIGTLEIDAFFNGKEFKGASRVSKTWVKLEGVWQVALMHATDARLQSQWESLMLTAQAQNPLRGVVDRQIAASSAQFKSLKFSLRPAAPAKDAADGLPIGVLSTQGTAPRISKSDE